MVILSCKDLNVQYDNQVALKDVTFEIEDGDYLCIIGDNGSGKSTLMKSILGLVTPKSGQIEYGSLLKSHDIGYLPQQTIIQRDFPASVYEVVLSGCLNKRGWRPFYSSDEKKRALDNLKKLKIEHLKKKCYRDLSGGQQQRVLIARALCASEKILLLDEPVTGLDPVTTANLYQIIEELNKEYGMSIIMVTHDMNSGLEHATKILRLNKEVVFYGTPSEYLCFTNSCHHMGEVKHV
ncbi:MAG: ABC transporter ATP-binding protein [Turicibacter sp.]|nr:ABC transporter ATP-binding protein [Turicibacter sp.]